MPASGVVPAGYSAPEPPGGKDAKQPTTPNPATGDNGVPKLTKAVPNELALADLINRTVGRNPRLAQVGWAVETARGLAAPQRPH